MWKYLEVFSNLQRYAFLHDTILDTVHTTEAVSPVNFLSASVAFSDDNQTYPIVLFVFVCSAMTLTLFKHTASTGKSNSTLQLEFSTTGKEIYIHHAFVFYDS